MLGARLSKKGMKTVREIWIPWNKFRMSGKGGAQRIPALLLHGTYKKNASKNHSRTSIYTLGSHNSHFQDPGIL
jgi:hypothetical protein